jgi:hypothetical protein
MGTEPFFRFDYPQFERDFFIFQQIKDAFNDELTRSDKLDTKSNYIIAFVGVILSFNAILITFLIKEINNTKPYYAPLFSLIIVSFFLILIAILWVLMAVKIRTWTHVPNSQYLLDHYAKGDKNLKEILTNITVEYSNAIKENQEKNQSKANNIQFSLYFLAIGISIFFLCVMASFIIICYNL